jgi:urease accessory protein
VWANSPLKILVPRPRGTTVWTCLSSLGGGLVPGDEIEITMSLAKDTRCFVTTQASTKVYRNPNALPCSHCLRAELGPGSLLALIPDPVQPFMGSRYQQRQEFWLEPGSGLVLVDWLCAGRAARGERWAFGCYQSRNEIFSGGTRVFLDSLLLDPTDGLLEHSYRMGRFNCLVLMVVIGEPLQTASERLLRDVANLPLPRAAPLVCSASPIAEGALIRLAGQSVESVGRETRRLLDFLSELLQIPPWPNK